MRQQPYLGVYASMEFPPYRHQEYPKWVKRKDGTGVIVHSQSEELKLIDELAPEEESVQQNDVILSQAKEIEELKKQLAASQTKPAPEPIKAPATK